MLMQILSRTPLWVWALLAGLLLLGLSQMRDRQLRPAQIVALPLSLFVLGLVSLWPLARAVPLAALCWLLALGFSAWAVLRLARGGADPSTSVAQAAAQASKARRVEPRWNAQSARLAVPGSVLPLLVILVIFGLKYSLGVAFAIQPTWAARADIAMPVAGLYGAISGLFLARAWRLLAYTPVRGLA